MSVMSLTYPFKNLRVRPPKAPIPADRPHLRLCFPQREEAILPRLLSQKSYDFLLYFQIIARASETTAAAAGDCRENRGQWRTGPFREFRDSRRGNDAIAKTLS